VFDGEKYVKQNKNELYFKFYIQIFQKFYVALYIFRPLQKETILLQKSSFHSLYLG